MHKFRRSAIRAIQQEHDHSSASLAADVSQDAPVLQSCNGVPCSHMAFSHGMPPCCSYVEESNADKAIKALAAALAPKARVKRNGKVESIEAKELVPGDIVIIQFGNIVPADVKLLGKSGSDEVPMQVCGV